MTRNSLILSLTTSTILAISCKSSDSGDLPHVFENEISLSPFVDGLFEAADTDSDPDRGGYFPVRHYFWPLGLTALDAPEPPYEIRELSMWALSGTYTACDNFDENWECQAPSHCDTRVPVKLVAYVGEEPPNSFEGGEGDMELPNLPIIASVEVTGDRGAQTDWEPELLTGVLDEPVPVDESGPLWIGYMQATESGVSVACAASYDALATELSDSDRSEFVWWEQNNLFTEGNTGWNITNPDDSTQMRAVVQATIGY